MTLHAKKLWRKLEWERRTGEDAFGMEDALAIRRLIAQSIEVFVMGLAKPPRAAEEPEEERVGPPPW